MNIQKFLKIINSDFYVGVPDSQLKSLCNYLMNEYGIDGKHHIIAANEGNAVAIAAGYYLSTSKVPVVYLQNSGEGNIINPVASLLNDKVYKIPMIFIIGWRGEPGVHDEPQHIFQGEITTQLLDVMNIEYFIISKDTTEKEVVSKMREFNKILGTGKNVAFIIKKGALKYKKEIEYKNSNLINREDIIKHIVAISKDDPIISTTGKASRELFEIRELNKDSHKYDFLTVGSMGHASSIALGVAINKPNSKIWIIDGDGAFLMHMGAIPVIASINPNNIIHILINNCAHETVGGMPTVSNNINYKNLALDCGYKKSYSVNDLDTLDKVLRKVKKGNDLTFIEIKCSILSRNNLGRPTISTLNNKENFMNYLNELK